MQPPSVHHVGKSACAPSSCRTAAQAVQAGLQMHQAGRQAGLRAHQGAAPKRQLARVSLVKPAVKGVYERLAGSCCSCHCRVQPVPRLPQVIKHPAAQAKDALECFSP